MPKKTPLSKSCATGSEQAALSHLESEALIQAEIELQQRIKTVNNKSLKISLTGTACSAILAVMFCPFATPHFFSLLATTIWTFVFSMATFGILYQLIFYYADKNLIPEARKRGQYWAEKLFNNHFFRWGIVDYHRYDIFENNNRFFESSIDRRYDESRITREDPTTSFNYRHESSNIYYRHDH